MVADDLPQCWILKVVHHHVVTSSSKGVWLLALASIVSLSGCASEKTDALTPAISIPALGQIPVGQRDVLADGYVTAIEYQAAFEDWRACSESAGGEVVIAERDTISGLILYGTRGAIGSPEAADRSTPEGACYADLFSWIDFVFQTTDPLVLDYINSNNVGQFNEEMRPCLEANGVSVAKEILPGTEEFGQLTAEWQKLQADGMCVVEGG